MLSFNRILHYFSFITNNPLPDKFLPRNINILQVLTLNEMFVPMLIQNGMQGVLNKRKQLICFLSLMTLYLKKQMELNI